MNQYEVPTDPNRLCYFCDKPAVVMLYVNITSEYEREETLDELIESMKEGREMQRPCRGAIKIAADSCEEHDTALSEAIEDATGHGVSMWSLTKSTCPDQWHGGGDEYLESETEPAIVPGSNWTESHYECPTCGATTMTHFAIPSDITDAPAYIYAYGAFARALGDK